MLGWVKLHRKLLENPIFKNANLFHLYIYCLLKARHEKGQVIFGENIIELEEGQFLTGRYKLSEALNEKPDTTYKRLKKLEKLNYISLKSNNKNTIVTIENWGVYQSEIEKVTTESQQSNNKVTTKSQQSNTNKNVKNEKNEKNEKNKKHIYGTYKNIKLTDIEKQKLDTDYGNADELITYLDEYVEMKGIKYKSHYLAIKKWVVDAVERKNKGGGYQKNEKSSSAIDEIWRDEILGAK